MQTRDITQWETSISEVVSSQDDEDIVIRGRPLNELIGQITFTDVMFLMLQGRLPTDAERHVLDALLVASVEHGIAPPSMIARCYASYGTTIQAAVGAGVSAFGDKMGGLGEQLARLMFEEASAGSLTQASSDAEIDAIAKSIVVRYSDHGQRLPGFGIPYHNADPRAPAVLSVAKRKGTYSLYCRFAHSLEQALAKQRQGKTVPMNLDGVGAAVILDLGFAWQSARLFLITPRTVSMGAHYLEEAEQNTTWRHVPSANISFEP